MKDISNFKLYTKIMNYNEYTRQFVCNEIPAVHRDLKIHMQDEAYMLIKYMFEALHNKGNIRNKNINEMIVTLSMLDTLSSFVLKVCPKNKKHIITSIGFLTEIKNITFAWKKNEEDGKAENI